MRPTILHWKVMLVLLAVVIGGASLGSALRPASTHTAFPNQLYGVGIGSGTVQPVPFDPCKPLPRTASKAQRQAVRVFRRQLCHKHH